MTASDDNHAELKAELDELRAYKERHETCRRDLSLWLLEMENKHAAFGVMLERLRRSLVPA